MGCPAQRAVREAGGSEVFAWVERKRRLRHAGRSGATRRLDVVQIQHLYRIEKHLCEAKAGPAGRQAARASQSSMITERIHRALTHMKLSPLHLPQSAMGKAIDYTLALWPMLLVYLDGGRIEIGRVENRRGDCRRRELLLPAVFTVIVPVPQSLPWFRFLFPLLEPDVQISRIRLSSPTFRPSHSTGQHDSLAA